MQGHQKASKNSKKRFEVRLNGVSARQFGIKGMLDGHAGAEDFLEESYGRLHESGLRLTLSL